MSAAPAPFVVYYRVSTAKQGQSGLGLEAQQMAVQAYLRQCGGTAAEVFTEVESGKRNDRPELMKALQKCRQRRATLLVAKFDRLSRNAAFLLTLRNSDTKFVAADMPDANNLTIGVLAVIAEHEREMISKRTKEALQAAKARGVKLGNPRIQAGDDRSASLARQARDANYAARAADLRPLVEQALEGDPENKPQAVLRLFGLMGVPAPRGGTTWDARAVKRLMKFLQIPC